MVYVGTPTFRHNYGTNNFVHGGKPLGWRGGSAGFEICMGANYFNKKDIIISFASGFAQNGDETITQRIFDKYGTYLQGPFPSGSRKNYRYNQASFIYNLNIGISISGFIQRSSDFYLLKLKLLIPIFI